MIAFQTMAFGDVEAGIWGVAWLARREPAVRLAVQRTGVTTVLDAELKVDSAEDIWHLSGAGASLALAPIHPARYGAAGGLETSDQLCSVTGELELDGARTELSCPGWRSSTQDEAAPDDFGSLRWVAGWLGEGEGFSLLALRPRKARGHDSDLIAAVLIEEPPPGPIDDPRLSTTYTDDGRPSRIGLELWFEASEQPVSDDGSPAQFARRAAGRAVGQPLEWEADGFALRASPVAWRSHSRDGSGIYLLGERR